MNVRDTLCIALWIAGSGLLPLAPLPARPTTAVGDPDPLPGTGSLTWTGDIASRLVAAVDAFLLRQIELSLEARERAWPKDLRDPRTYASHMETRRRRLARIAGVVDERDPRPAIEFVSTTQRPSLAGRGEGFEAHVVRWPVLRAIQGEGLLLEPTDREPVATVIALPDADQTPEMIAGLAPGVAPESQYARRLAESGCRVLAVALIDRGKDFSTTMNGRRETGLGHREFLYRPAFELGRHIIGYEIQKILAAVDAFEREREKGASAPTGLVGYGEGGLLALYATAIDPRITAALVSGYFDSRQAIWREPIERNVFGLLGDFGDAELAAMVAPRALTVEASAAPPVDVPAGGRAAPGRIVTPPPERVRREVARAAERARGPGPGWSPRLVISADGLGPFGTELALGAFLADLAPGAGVAPDAGPPRRLAPQEDPPVRLRRQIEQIDRTTQWLLQESEAIRREFWREARRSNDLRAWLASVKPYRTYFRDRIIGRFDLELDPPAARSRKIFETPQCTGYELVLDVFDGVFTYGILLVPDGIGEAERRPVVVCQHGLEGRPRDVADPDRQVAAYNQFAVRLAERGFVTFAPQNLYIFGDRFRTLQRKANAIGRTLFSIMVPQHRQLVKWLATLPFVDRDRIAFYGLSYGGKSAMRIPPLVPEYCLSICSADFNEWIWKNASTRSPYSYVSTKEYEIFEFGLGMRFNYAEMAALIAPRPFMVERGHRDGVAPDWTVAYEYAKVRLLYADLGIPDRTRIEFFDGPHAIHGVGTFEFLHEHLDWPMKEKPRSLIRR